MIALLLGGQSYDLPVCRNVFGYTVLLTISYHQLMFLSGVANILLRKFDTSSKKEMKMVKTHYKNSEKM